MRFIVVFVCILMLTGLGILPSHADKRVALVIGNGAYQYAPVLLNPKNDAADVGRALELLGFKTIVATDLDRNGMNDALDRFSHIITDAEIAMVYYSGHAMQYEGRNYLLPTDIQLSTAADVNRLRLTLLDDVIDVLQAAPGARVIVLDSCRNNPLENELKRRVVTMPGRNRDAVLNRGLVRVSAASGMIIAYATQSGEVAADGTGRNSHFTSAFLNNVGTPEIDLRQMLFRVQDEVSRKTNGRQRPEISISLTGEFKLNSVVALPKADGNRPIVSSPSIADPAERAWSAVQNTASIAMLEAFLKLYRDSFYAPFAQARIAELRSGQTGASRLALPNGGPCDDHTPVSVSLSARSATPLSASEACALKPGDVFKECEACPEMVVIPAGTFSMGSPDGADKTERPQHRVSFANQFAAGRFSVTFDEWDVCVADGGCNAYRPPDLGWGRGRRPVINVSLIDANAYAAWLSGKTGKSYGLLSEAEREYVTRAGTTTPYWWGAAISPQQANYDDGNKSGSYRAATLPVDSFQPNPWGLYQVHGNVSEWTQDCWHDNFSGAPSDGLAWITGDCSRRVIRGGSWRGGSRTLQAAYRTNNFFDQRLSVIGFRLQRRLGAYP